MNTQHDESIELAGAYVLDALEPEEFAGFVAHLATCAVCRAEVAQLQQVVDVLPLAVEILEPPDSLRDRILRDAGQDLPKFTSLPGGAPARPVGQSRKPRWRTPETWLGAAAAAVIIALGGWNIQLHQQGNSTSPATAILLDAIKNGATVSPVGHTALAPGADAEIVQPRHGAPALLAVRGLPRTPSNDVYEVWLTRGGTPAKAGLFTYSGGGDWQIVPLPKSSNGYATTAVTNEPSPNGSLSPTGQQYLRGKLGA